MKQIALVFTFLLLTFSQNVLSAKTTQCQQLLAKCHNAWKAKDYRECNDKCSQAIAACAPAHEEGSTDSATATRRDCKTKGRIN